MFPKRVQRESSSQSDNRESGTIAQRALTLQDVEQNILCLCLIILSAFAQDQETAVFPPVDVVVRSITLGQTPDEKQNTFWAVIATLTLDLAKEQYADRDYMWPLELQATLFGRSLPDPSLLPQEEAEAIARQAACEKYGLTEETLVSTHRIYPTYFSSYVSSEGRHLTDTWRFLFRPRSDDYFQVFMDAATGEVVEIADETDTKG